MERLQWVVGQAEKGMRLDRYVAAKAAGASRTAVQRAIRSGDVLVNAAPAARPSLELRGGEKVTWVRTQAPLLSPQRIPLNILYEDESLLVVDKPAGQVVHPGAGRHGTTLVEGLLADRALPASDDPARPGIVHRLDKETSGVLVVAKTTQALRALQAAFAERRVQKAYLAVVEGLLDEDEGAIDAPIGRDPSRPRRMAIRPDGRAADTEFRVLRRWAGKTLVLVSPRTGRTHQVRVHLRYIGHPVCGDSLYGRRGEETRLLLHAWRLELSHPVSGKRVRFEAPVPEAFPPYAYGNVGWPESLP